MSNLCITYPYKTAQWQEVYNHSLICTIQHTVPQMEDNQICCLLKILYHAPMSVHPLSSLYHTWCNLPWRSHEYSGTSPLAVGSGWSWIEVNFIHKTIYNMASSMIWLNKSGPLSDCFRQVVALYTRIALLPVPWLPSPTHHSDTTRATFPNTPHYQGYLPQHTTSCKHHPLLYSHTFPFSAQTPTLIH